MGFRRLAGCVSLLILLSLAPASAASAQSFAGKVTRYVDPAQQTALSFGDRSHWHQPWRAYMETVPAQRLRNAAGINFNVQPAEADATARLLAANGFRRARVEVTWGEVSYDTPTRLADPTGLRTKLAALKRYGIRPLILVNSHHGIPTPRRPFDAELAQPAARGARRVRLTAATVAQVSPGRTGFNDLTTGFKSADVLFTSVDADGWANLSRPLPRDLPAGRHRASTLRYEPFARPRLADGLPNPQFEATMRGWLDYLRAATSEVKTSLGSDAFDVEIWNEQSFGADFLDADNYYDPPRGQTYAAAVHETPGLVSYWRLGERSGLNAADGRGLSDGTYRGAVLLGEAGAPVGDPNTAVRLDSGYVEAPDSPSLDLGDRLSIEGWVRRAADGSNQVIVGKGSGAYVLWITGDRLSLRKSHVGNIAQSTTALIPDGRWHHVAATKDGANVRLFIDGQDVTGPVTNRTLTDSTASLQIGANTSNTFLRGEVDDVSVYNAPLSAGTIRAHHDAGRVDPAATRGTADKEILARSVAWLRDPTSGVPAVRIGNGFASQRPWDAGSTSPPGLTAIDKHPYPYSGMRRFPPAAVDGTRPLDAQGDPDGTKDALGRWTERFTPRYDVFHPELYLTAAHKHQRYGGFPIEMDHLIRDLSPITTTLNGVAHGRSTHPPGGAPPTMWVTEMNVDPSGVPSSFGLTEADRPRLQAKATLRTLVSFVNKGVSAVDFYAVKDGNFALVSGSFFGSLANGYPGDGAGGPVMDSVRRLRAGLSGAVDLAQPRQLSLIEIGDYSGKRVFEGDGSADHPPLHNRDVLAFLPFQVTDRRFVIPVYVMTPNLARSYRTGTDPGRLDMPAETYRLTIGGVRGTSATASASDPLTGASVAVKVVSRASDRMVVELPVTDSPRLLTINES